MQDNKTQFTKAADFPEPDEQYIGRLRHMINANADSAYKTLGAPQNADARPLSYYVYGDTGIIANMISIGLDPNNANAYRGLKVHQSDMRLFHKKLRAANPEITHGIYELPEDTLWTLTPQQLNFYRHCQNHAKPAQLKLVEN